MDVAIIVIIIIGVICVAASFFVKDKKEIGEDEKEKLAEEVRKKVLSEESMEGIFSDTREKFTARLGAIADDSLERSEDRMSETANTKMLAINDMAEQLIAKIEQNHKEVVFLYDMLNEKDDKLKDFSAKLEGMRKQIEAEESRLNDIKSDIENEKEKIAKSVKTEKVHEILKPHDKISENKEIASETDKNIEKKEETKKEPKHLDINAKILELHAEGKTVLEISKKLGMGQGEVNLILGLYAGK